MPEQAYPYSKSADFPGGAIDSSNLVDEIAASSIATSLNRIDVTGNDISIVFASALSAEDKTTLDNDATGPAGGLIAAHDNTASPLAGFGEIAKTITTTDGTPKTIHTIAVPDDTVIEIWAQIVGRRTDDAGYVGGVVRATVYREAAGGVVVGGVSTDWGCTNAAGYDLGVVASGNNALIQVTGAAAHTLNWRAVSMTNSIA